MRDAAVSSLSYPLGTVVFGEGYAVLLELHRDARRGEHKGASVLLPVGGAG